MVEEVSMDEYWYLLAKDILSNYSVPTTQNNTIIQSSEIINALRHFMQEFHLNIQPPLFEQISNEITTSTERTIEATHKLLGKILSKDLNNIMQPFLPPQSIALKKYSDFLRQYDPVLNQRPGTQNIGSQLILFPSTWNELTCINFRDLLTPYKRSLKVQNFPFIEENRGNKENKTDPPLTVLMQPSSNLNFDLKYSIFIEYWDINHIKDKRSRSKLGKLSSGMIIQIGNNLPKSALKSAANITYWPIHTNNYKPLEINHFSLSLETNGGGIILKAQYPIQLHFPNQTAQLNQGECIQLPVNTPPNELVAGNTNFLIKIKSLQ